MKEKGIFKTELDLLGSLKCREQNGVKTGNGVLQSGRFQDKGREQYIYIRERCDKLCVFRKLSEKMNCLLSIFVMGHKDMVLVFIT